MKDYIRSMRKYLGNELFIHPGARILIANKEGEFLVIRRVDNGKTGIPAGAFELNETIEQCIRREVEEEVGLTLGEVHLIGLSTNPLIEKVTYPNGDKIQYFTAEFYCDDWSGSPHVNDSKEVLHVEFVPLNALGVLPENERNILKSLEYYNKTGRVLLG